MWVAFKQQVLRERAYENSFFCSHDGRSPFPSYQSPNRSVESVQTFQKLKKPETRDSIENKLKIGMQSWQVTQHY